MKPILGPLLVGAFLVLATGALPHDEQHQKVAQTGTESNIINRLVIQRVKRQATNSTSTAKKRGLIFGKPSKKPGKPDKPPGKPDKATAAAECLAAHNKWRRLHNVPDLEWDDKIAAFAQKRSDHIAASDGKEFGHPPDLPFGENLFWHSSYSKGCDYMVKGWYDEISLYDFKSPSFSSATGHFTQVVWRGTKRVGCAFATSSDSRGGTYLTCNYDPAGNWLGEFDANVPRPSPRAGSEARDMIEPASQSAATGTTMAPVTTTTGATTARPSTTTTTALASSTETTSSVATTTTKPKSKKRRKKKMKKNKKQGDKDKEKKPEEKPKAKKRKGKKKKKTKKKTTTSTSAPYSSTGSS